MSRKHSALALTALTMAAAAFAPATEAVTITRGFSGLWHDTNAKRGFSAEIVQTAAGKQLVAYWITTDAAGKPLWVIGQGPITGNKAVLAAVVGNAATQAAGTQSWGQMTVTFSDCAHGTVQFAPSDSRQPRGQTTIARLSPDAGKSCSGGISDDHGGGGDVRIVQFFTNTGVVPAASGRARFEDRSDRSDFNVEAEDLPIGDYSLRVGGVEKATLTVTTSANGTEGEVEFRSPAEAGKILLDFDPRGQRVEIAQGSTVFLTTTMGTESGGGGGGGNNAGGPIDRYELRVEGAHDGPEFKARLDAGRQRSNFHVELEDVAAGSYTLNIGGTDRGTIDVVAVQGGTEGEIEFRDPPEPDHLPLDFDPRGALVQILSKGSVILSGTFPTQPNHGGGSGGGSGGGGSGGGSGGGDDPPGDDHGGGGNDDPPGDDHGGGGGGSDDMPGDDHGGSGGSGGRHGRH